MSPPATSPAPQADTLTLPTTLLVRTGARARKSLPLPLWLGRLSGRAALGLLLPLTLLGLWQLTAARGWISPQILPAPAVVYDTFIDLIRSGDTPANLWVSLQRVLYGFLAATVLGGVFGTLMALSPAVRAYLYPSFNVFTQIPALGWIPLLMMFVGIGETLKIIIIVKAALVPVAVNVYQGICNIPESHFEVAAVFRFTRAQVVRRVVLPAALPSVFNGLRGGLTHAWLALVTVELLASSEGIGYQLVNARQLFKLDEVLATIVVIGAVGLIIDLLFQLAESRLLRWRRSAF